MPRDLFWCLSMSLHMQRAAESLCLGWVQGQTGVSWQFYIPNRWLAARTATLRWELPPFEGFKSVLWWCVACCIYVWTLAGSIDTSGLCGPSLYTAGAGGGGLLLHPGRLPCVDIWKTKLHSAVKCEPHTRRGEAAVWWGEQKKYRNTQREGICGGRKGKKQHWRKYPTPCKMREMSFKAAPPPQLPPPSPFLLCAGCCSPEWFQSSFGSNQLSEKICFQYEAAYTGNSSPHHRAAALLSLPLCPAACCTTPTPPTPQTRSEVVFFLIIPIPNRWVMESYALNSVVGKCEVCERPEFRFWATCDDSLNNREIDTWRQIIESSL